MYGLIADPAQLAVLRGAVHAYCEKHGIVDAAARERVAGQVLDLFSLGVIEPDALASGLDRRLSHLDQPVARLPGGLSLRSGSEKGILSEEPSGGPVVKLRKAG